MEWADIFGWDQQIIEDLRNLGFSYVKQGKYEIARSIFEVLLLINEKNVYDLQT